MATAYIYNGFGQYDSRDDVAGIFLHYAGVPFFLPFGKVTPIPDWTVRQVDHDKTTPDGEGEGALTYLTFGVQGKRIAEELLHTQIPISNAKKGIIEVTGKQTGKLFPVECGVSQLGEILTTEIREVEATQAEKDRAAALALDYKKSVIQEYFQSKRERMAGGKGQLFPRGLVKVYMDELGVEDIDDVSRHQKNAGGFDPEILRVILEESRKGQQITSAEILRAVESVRKAGKVQLAPGKPKSAGLAEYKQAYDAAIAEGKTAEEARELAAEA